MNKKMLSRIILIFLILFIFLLMFIILLLISIKNQTGQDSDASVNIEKQPETIQEVIEKYDSTYINQENNEIYLNFSKNLYEEDGHSNEKFFTDLINDLIPFFELENFYLIDKEKDINIFIKYEDDKHTIIINDIEDFYSKIDADKYVKVEKAEITGYSNLEINDYYLEILEVSNSYFSSIKDKLGEGTDIGNGYKSYLDDKIQIRTVPSGAVKNLIFTDKYKGNITSNIDTEMSLQEIAQKEPSYSLGSIDKGYLGYRLKNFYLFFYKDEISCYSYNYKNNADFEKFLRNYLETKNLNTFILSLKNKWQSYDSFEYDETTNSAHIVYSTRGVEINIKDNDPSNIVFYQNYYFTDYTKSLVKQGIVQFEDVDAVEKIEIERRSVDR